MFRFYSPRTPFLNKLTGVKYPAPMLYHLFLHRLPLQYGAYCVFTIVEPLISMYISIRVTAFN